MISICLEGIIKDIKENRVLNDISLQMTGGKIYGLRGKNGCGKTMLMRAICGFIIPTKGKVIINGKQLHKDIHFPESIGVLIENPAFLNEYSGYKNLKLIGDILGGVKSEDIEHALYQAGLDAKDKKTYGKYSLGMKQKLGIANALLCEPEIIILDEPINALDEDSMKKIKETLLRIRDNGKIILVACHDKEELNYLADEIFIMSEGKIIGREKKENEIFVSV